MNWKKTKVSIYKALEGFQALVKLILAQPLNALARVPETQTQFFPSATLLESLERSSWVKAVFRLKEIISLLALFLSYTIDFLESGRVSVVTPDIQ